MLPNFKLGQRSIHSVHVHSATYTSVYRVSHSYAMGKNVINIAYYSEGMQPGSIVYLSSFVSGSQGLCRCALYSV